MPMKPLDRRTFLQLATGGAILAVQTVPAREAPSMLTKQIPATGEALPVIGMGTWQTFDVGSSAAERAPLEEVLSMFASQGGKLVDSSPMYGQSETVLGDLMQAQRLQKQLFVATKVWTSGKAQGVRQMETSMSRLKVSKLDLMQVHNLVDVEAHLDTLQDWKQAGKIRYAGVTHYTASAHDEVARVLLRRPVDFVQINYSVGEREAERRLLPLAQEKGIAVIANRPFVGGDLLRRLANRPVPDWAREIDCTSWAQLLLKFVVSHPAITCAIPATSRVTHLRDNMRAGTGALPDESLRARIAAAALG